MIEKLVFDDNDVIAVIAPHPDDECLGASAALLMAPEKTDIYVLSDGSHGGHGKSIEEEAVIRKKQFDEEMAYVKPGNYFWLGYEDTTLDKHFEAAEGIDLTKYTKVFLPWHESPHPNHRAACEMCCMAIISQKASPDCYIYEVNKPLPEPTHYVDITEIADEKRKLIGFHKDQEGHMEITMSLDRDRGARLLGGAAEYAECYLRVDPYEIAHKEER